MPGQPDQPTHVLTLTDERPPEDASGSEVAYDGLDFLAISPLAVAERGGRVGGADASYLSRFEGTDLVQWYGRRSDGCWHPIGRIMKIYRVADAPV
jgi:hypothetical protein